MTQKLKVHPFAATYPPMSETELEALTADIAERGLQRPIVLYQGQILDGRNRYAACEKAGIEPAFVEYEGDDPLGQVNSLNLSRDLTAAQRAIVAARQWLLNGRDKKVGRPGKEETSQSGTFSVKDLAKRFRVSHTNISQARDLLAEAPDLATAVDSCAMSLAAAHTQFQDRKRQAAQKEKDAKRVAEFSDAISNGEIKLEDALQQAIEQEREEKERIASQADARKHWLKEFAELLDWLERFASGRTDEHLAWYTEPGSPGLFDHGITSNRVKDGISTMNRIMTITFGSSSHDGKSTGKEGGTRKSAKSA